MWTNSIRNPKKIFLWHSHSEATKKTQAFEKLTQAEWFGVELFAGKIWCHLMVVQTQTQNSVWADIQKWNFSIALRGWELCCERASVPWIYSHSGVEGMVQLNERKDTFQYWKYSLEFKVEFRSDNMSCVCEYSLSLYLLPRLLFSFSEASSYLIWWACPEQHISTDSTSWQQLTSMICRCL